jgi:hypothetical protein
MALSCAQGEGTRVTSNAYNQSFTGIGFQPKALLIWTTGADGGYNSYPGASGIALGWATSTLNETTQSGLSDRSTHTFSSGAGPGFPTVGGTVQLASFDADGFTLTFGNGGAAHFYYMAIGGADVEAGLGTWTSAVGDFANEVVTGVGFRPDFVLTNIVGNNNCTWGIGMATGPSAQAACHHQVENGQRWTESFYNNSLAVAAEANFGTPSNFDATYRAVLQSFDADGLTVSVAENTGPETWTVDFLALKSPSTQFKVGVDTQKTSTGTKSTTGIGFAPGAGFFSGTNRVATTGRTGTASANLGVTVGFAAGWPVVSSAMALLMWNNPVIPVDENAGRGVSGIVLSNSTPKTTTLAEASVDSYDADGFTLDWTTADAIARYFMYGVFENALVPGPAVSFADVVFPQ